MRSIHKFGGAALTDGAAIRRAAELIKHTLGGTSPSALSPPQLVVTTSAMAAVTNTLFDIAVRAAADEQETSAAGLDALRQQHVQAWDEACDGAPLPSEFTALFANADATLRSVAATHTLTPSALDGFVTVGEQLAAHLLASALRAQGVEATYVNAVDVLYTEGRSGNAVPDLVQTAHAAQRILEPLLSAGIVPVVPGYIARGGDGAVVTLGRGGTDLSATALAAALDAGEVVLWKDVAGFLTADPRVVSDARVIPQLHMREAAELAYYGAKILHPRALAPLRGRDCVVRLRPFADPLASGTTITTHIAGKRQPVCALSASTNQALVTVGGSGMLGVPGIATRTFDALQQAGIAVSLISQASSEHSICLGVSADQAEATKNQLEEVFHEELRRGEIDYIGVREATATLAIVGLGMAGQPGVAARVFTALGKQDINVIAVAHGSSELNVSVVVDASNADRAQRAVHDEFQLGKIGGGRPVSGSGAARSDVILLGFGLIGRTLAQMLIERETPAHALRVVCIIDRSGYIFDPEGLSAEQIHELVRAKRDGQRLAMYGTAATAMDAVTHALSHALLHPVLIDMTADETSPVLEYAVSHGADLVLANKRPVGGNRAHAESLRSLAASHGRRVLHEATVGAGLPILDTFAKLVDAGDTVRCIEGCPSGTMGYLFGELGRGTPFSTALRGAMQLGYTEPDPRDDLSGADVARKGLILGRLLGFSGEFDDVQVESLVPPDAATLPLADFLGRLESYDAAWADRMEQAGARGAVLRYRATATRDSVTVGLVEVPAMSALGALNGTDNQFSFTTERYDTNPLVISGPGAGPAVTAAGVLNDVLKLAGVR
jgi:aspartokinase/homoserine dehydrogenase 1